MVVLKRFFERQERRCISSTHAWRIVCWGFLVDLQVPRFLIVRSLSAKYRPDRYKRDKSIKFGTELP